MYKKALYKKIFLLFLTTLFINLSYAHQIFIVTGYGTWGKTPNPSEEVVNLLPSYICANGSDECTDEFRVVLIKAILPVSWDKAGVQLSALIDRYKDDTQNHLIGIVSLGATGTSGITLEQFATNSEYGEDEEGVDKGETKACKFFSTFCPKIIEGGPFSLRMPQNVYLNQIKARINSMYPNFTINIGKDYLSNNYLCNLAFYTSLYRTRDNDIFAGFIHLQFTDEKDALTSKQVKDATIEYIKFVIAHSN